MEEVRHPHAAPRAPVEPSVDIRERVLASRGARPGRRVHEHFADTIVVA